MPELRISDIPGAAGATGRRVEVTWQDDRARRVAVAEFGLPPDRSDSELLRWYLEEYAEAPADPAPALAASAERVLADAGAELFRQVFSSPDAAGIWERARDQLDEVRVEVDADPGDGPGLAWELLRDPALDAPVALGAGAFVRTHARAAGHPRLPAPAGDRLRVLLVICRPGGRDDVPFRSVASRLVRGGADQMAGLDLDVLRPPTFARLAAGAARRQGGRPPVPRGALRRARRLPRRRRLEPGRSRRRPGRRRGRDRAVTAAVRNLGGRPGSLRAARLPAVRGTGQRSGEHPAGRRADARAAADRDPGAGAGAQCLPVGLRRGQVPARRRRPAR